MCVFLYGCVHRATPIVVHICMCINQLSPPPSLPVVYGSPAGSHIGLLFDGDTHDSWLFETVCFHYASSSARKLHHCFVQRRHIWARMRGKNFKRRVFFGTTRNKGAWFGYGEKKLKSGRRLPCPRLLFPPALGFRGGQGIMLCLGKVGVEGLEKSKVQSLLEHPI